MYAVIITAKTTMTRDEIPDKAVMMAEKQAQSGDTAGLIQKTFIYNGSTIGGFLLFTDRGSAQAFLDGPFWAQAKARPGIDDVDVRHYEVADAASVVLGTGTRPLRPPVAA